MEDGWVMIEVKNLCKYYGDYKAVDNLNFRIGEGEIVGFLGLNGAGKSTTMNMLTGYLAASCGQILIAGKDILEEPKKVKKAIGYLPEVPPLYPDMTVMEYLSFMYELKGVKQPRREHLQEICTLAGIDKVSGRLIGNLSKGYRQRVGIAYALVGNPPILILDEPTAGLDPKQIMDIRELIVRLGRKHTIMLSTHILSEVQAVCRRIIVINAGKIVADGNTDSIAAELSGERGLIARIEGPRGEVAAALRNMPGVRKVQCRQTQEKNVYEYTLSEEGGADLRRSLFTLLAARSWPLLACRSTEYTLEEMFIRLTDSGVSAEENQQTV